MDKEIIETVLLEVSEEVQHSNTLIKECNQAIIENTKQVTNLFNKLDKSQVKVPAIDMGKIEILIDQKFEKFSSQLDSFPKKHSFRILLFPEHGTTSHCKVVFGRIFFWLVILCIAKYAYLLGGKWITEH